MIERTERRRIEALCTFHRDGAFCGRAEEDETIHVWPGDRMRPGFHVWRHDRRDELGLGKTGRLTTLATADELAVREQLTAILDSLPEASRERVIRALVELFRP